MYWRATPTHNYSDKNSAGEEAGQVFINAGDILWNNLGHYIPYLVIKASLSHQVRL